ncbi:MAG: hypothetical protein VXY89_10765, partial [SAR324 cluster bacterium]|nr:hypothetical protein [SAR324 cluster bacterium]
RRLLHWRRPPLAGQLRGPPRSRRDPRRSQDPEQHHEQDPESSGCKSQFHGMLGGNHDCNGGEGSDD